MQRKIKISELLNPKTSDKHQAELMQYFEQGGTWQELLGFDFNTMAIQYKAAYELYQASDFKKAAAAFSYLTTVNPYEFTYWMGLGVSKQSDRAFEEAIVAFSVAEAILPSTPLPHLHLAQCYYAIQQKEKAISHLQQAIEVAGEYPEHQEIKQKAYVLLKNLPK